MDHQHRSKDEDDSALDLLALAAERSRDLSDAPPQSPTCARSKAESGVDHNAFLEAQQSPCPAGGQLVLKDGQPEEEQQQPEQADNDSHAESTNVRRSTLPGAYAAFPGTELQRAPTISRSIVGVPSTEFSVDHDNNTDDDETIANDQQAFHNRTTAAFSSGRRQVGQSSGLPVAPNERDPEAATGGVNGSSSGLVEARLVVDDDNIPVPSQLPQAQEDYDTQETIRNKNEQWTKQFKTNILVAVLALVATFTITMAFVIPHSGKSNDNTEMIPVPTNAPSMSPSWSLEGHIQALLEGDTLLALENPTSPQFHAYQWLLKDSTINLATTYSNDRIIQKFALATLYFATQGDSWTNNAHWLNHSVHECDWFQQADFGRKHMLSQLIPAYLEGYLEPLPETHCDPSTGLYQHLWLDMNNLVGSLPTELYMMTSLQTLSLGWNNIEGTIASHLQQLTSLEGLFLSELLLTGTIPREVSLLSNLNVLFLDRNQIEGSIPSELWQLENLSDLCVADNQDLKGTLPTELGTFSKLRWLVMDECDLTGTIPTELGQMKALQWLLLSENTLTGQLPTELGLMENLLWFVLSNNGITGSIPSELGVTDVVAVSVCGNTMEGTVPSELGLATSLYTLALCDNHFTGPIPSEFGRLTQLGVSLNVRGNQFSHTIPTELAFLTALDELEFSSNQLSGQIPSEFGRLTSAGHLGLANNLFSGTVPLELSSLQQTLHTLELEVNPFLSGTLPQELCEINGTCVNSALGDNCGESVGLSFDCTSLLCGCGCHSCVNS